VEIENFGRMVARGENLKAWWEGEGSPSRAVVALAEEGEVRALGGLPGCRPGARPMGVLELRAVQRSARGSWLQRGGDGKLRVVAVLDFVDGVHPGDREARVFGATVVEACN